LTPPPALRAPPHRRWRWGGLIPAARPALSLALAGVGDQLLSRASDIGADLIVSGGYGHSRLREWVLGSEGRIGVITEATVRISRQPERERFVGVFFADWARARDAVRELVQARERIDRQQTWLAH